MNNKLKKSLLGTLIIGSSLAFTLPIVSCSAEAPVEDPQPIKKLLMLHSSTIIDFRQFNILLKRQKSIISILGLKK